MEDKNEIDPKNLTEKFGAVRDFLSKSNTSNKGDIQSDNNVGEQTKMIRYGEIIIPSLEKYLPVTPKIDVASTDSFSNINLLLKNIFENTILSFNIVGSQLNRINNNYYFWEDEGYFSESHLL